jgi:hypothetical protein
MGFLSKKSMLVSLLALSLAACTSTRTNLQTNTVELECDGDAGSYDAADTITFQLKAGSTCDLKRVSFIQDKHGNSKLFKEHPRNSGDPHVVFDYTGTSPVPGDGAYFYYITQSHSSPNPDGGGGGIIK